MAYLKEDGTVVQPPFPKPLASSPDVPQHAYRIESTDDGCRLIQWHNMEDRSVAELAIRMDRDDVLRLMGHALRRNENVIDPRLHIILRNGDAIFEVPGAGKFTMSTGSAIGFWLEWGTPNG